MSVSMRRERGEAKEYDLRMRQVKIYVCCKVVFKIFGCHFPIRTGCHVKGLF